MAEPTVSATGVGLLGLFVLMAGPVFGPYVYVVFGAVLGAFTALSAKHRADTWLIDALFLLRVTFTAMLFTAPLTLLIVKYLQLPLEFGTGAAAYVIGWKWDALSRFAWQQFGKGKLGLRGDE